MAYVVSYQYLLNATKFNKSMESMIKEVTKFDKLVKKVGGTAFKGAFKEFSGASKAIEDLNKSLIRTSAITKDLGKANIKRDTVLRKQGIISNAMLQRQESSQAFKQGVALTKSKTALTVQELKNVNKVENQLNEQTFRANQARLDRTAKTKERLSTQTFRTTESLALKSFRTAEYLAKHKNNIKIEKIKQASRIQLATDNQVAKVEDQLNSQVFKANQERLARGAKTRLAKSNYVFKATESSAQRAFKADEARVKYIRALQLASNKQVDKSTESLKEREFKKSSANIKHLRALKIESGRRVFRTNMANIREEQNALRKKKQLLRGSVGDLAGMYMTYDFLKGSVESLKTYQAAINATQAAGHLTSLQRTGLEASIMKQTKDSMFSPVDAAKVAQILAQSNASLEGIKAMMIPVLRMTKVSKIEPAVAAQKMISLEHIFSRIPKEAAGGKYTADASGRTKYILDYMIRGAHTAPMTVSDLSSMLSIVGPQAVAGTKVHLSQLISMLSVMRTGGLQPGMAARQLKNIFLTFSHPVGQAKKALQMMHIKPADIYKMLLSGNIQGILRMLKEHHMDFKLAGMLYGKRNISGSMMLQKASEKDASGKSEIDRIHAKIIDPKNLTFAEQFKKYTEGLPKALDAMTAARNRMVISFSSVAVPALTTLFGVITKAFDYIADLSPIMKKLIVYGAGALTGLLAFSTVRMIFSPLTKSVFRLYEGFKLLAGVSGAEGMASGFGKALASASRIPGVLKIIAVGLVAIGAGMVFIHNQRKKYKTDTAMYNAWYKNIKSFGSELLKLNAFVGKVIWDAVANITGFLGFLGKKLGSFLYKQFFDPSKMGKGLAMTATMFKSVAGVPLAPHEGNNWGMKMLHSKKIEIQTQEKHTNSLKDLTRTLNDLVAGLSKSGTIDLKLDKGLAVAGDSLSGLTLRGQNG